ncbi:MAG: 6-carboxytetrahydropterin synthase [Acidobacteriota bacterium]|nr:MAG: 6-carboxytetrahydropterin synthase [Acidobacteriota bacterium]
MATYALGVNTELTAKHFLVGGDFGPEGELHAHDYRVEVVLEGDELDEHGFLVDIVRVKAELARLVDRYRDAILNDLPELEGKNPGCEEFSRVFAESLRDGLDTRRLLNLTVKIWENSQAWAQCRLELSTPE